MDERWVLMGITLGLVVVQLVREITDFWVSRKK
jgi:hypothetical protein